jgi:sec-independent protein translocase protein TatA
MLELALIGSGPDIIVVMVVALLVFGPNRLPEVGRQVGQFLRDSRKMLATFTEAVNDAQTEVRVPLREQPSPVTRAGTVVGEVIRGASSSPVQQTPQMTISESASDSASESEHEVKSDAPV